MPDGYRANGTCRPFPVAEDACRNHDGEALLDAVERGADRVLEESGLRFQDDPETVDMLVAHGGVATGDVVRLDGAALRRRIRGNAPRSFVLRGRNPARDTVVGAGSPPVFAPVYGAPDTLLGNGTRTKGTRATYRSLVSLAHSAPAMSNTGHMVCVMDDVAEADRPLEMLLAHLELSDKPFMGTIASPEAAAEFIDLTRSAAGRPDVPGECHLLHLINCSPPRTYWENPLKCLRTVALRGEASMVSSYMMMGATSPVSVAGTLIQGYAEVLAGMALAQMWRPGAPVVMGILGYPFDMRSMIPVFGDPASQAVQMHAAGLARRLGVPARADGAVTSSKADDAQAGYEGGRALSAAFASGADFVLHAAGWLEQGRCVSVGKMEREAAAIGEAFPGRAGPFGPPRELDPAVRQEILGRLKNSALR